MGGFEGLRNRHLLHHAVSRGVVSVLNRDAVVVLHLDQAVQAVVSVLGASGQPRGSREEAQKGRQDD